VPYVVEAAAVEAVLVYPGIEVTCSDNAQCLVLFDPTAPSDVWNYLLGKLDGVTVAPRNDAKTAPTDVAEITVRELFDSIANDGRLRDVCVILPHFSDPGAHRHLNEEGHKDRFAKLECDGIYIEKPYHDLDPVTRQKAYGKIQEWGRRRKGFIATGDNRSANFDRLGQHECWIKIGENSSEALRQALLADEARITYAPPATPRAHAGGSLDGGQSRKTNLNPVAANIQQGTILSREWKGRMHRVAVLASGFVWNGKTYPSLSKVAFEITGTRWNGPRFFGLRDKVAAGSGARS
jgi:hypothetical protein